MAPRARRSFREMERERGELWDVGDDVIEDGS